MDTLVQHSGISNWHAAPAYLAIAATVLSAIALLLLHVLSPEFSPSWRMVSEYARGKFDWLLTIVFMAWAASSVSLLIALWPVTNGSIGKIGLVLLGLGALGQFMGGLFDIDHPLHGTAAMIGIPAVCAAAIILNLALSRHANIVSPPAWSAHLPLISFVLMIGALILFMSSLKAHGIDMTGQTGPLAKLPDGVSTLLGWANRMIFATSYLWNVLAAAAVVKAQS